MYPTSSTQIPARTPRLFDECLLSATRDFDLRNDHGPRTTASVTSFYRRNFTEVKTRVYWTVVARKLQSPECLHNNMQHLDSNNVPLSHSKMPCATIMLSSLLLAIISSTVLFSSDNSPRHTYVGLNFKRNFSYLRFLTTCAKHSFPQEYRTLKKFEAKNLLRH